ncbi:hypothetical protein Tco_1080767 [Tanacetum coccineum]|uniref:Zinc knuckle CX2CX4HX4C domain-containing protein n=1 Tax=Tanacetum coccineum TaxID=301880 RepID=A0ABQ5HVM4_9ASTR
MMLDSYTNTICLESWGRSSYARATVEVNAEKDLIKEMVVVVLKHEEHGYRKETISIEYEWKQPRFTTCMIFGHSNDECPKVVKAKKAVEQNVDQDGFQVVK